MLEYRNNWCANEYTVDGLQVNPTKVHVGGVGTFPVVSKIKTGTYNDMGCVYDCRTKEFYVIIDSPFGEVHGPSLQELLKGGYVIQVVEEEV